jgi:hypothetical protein
MIFFDDFGSQTSQRAVDTRRIHDASFFCEFHWCEMVARQVRSDK